MADLRQGLRDKRPDPGFWVRWRDWKFYADSNVVYVEDHEWFFVMPAEVKILHSYPLGVRVDCGDGRSYFIHDAGYAVGLAGLGIQALDEEAMRVLDHLAEEIHGKENRRA